MIRTPPLIFQELQVCNLFPRLPSQVPCGLKVDLEVLLKVTNQVCLVCQLVSLHVLATSKLQRVAFLISPSGTEDEMELEPISDS